MNGWLWFVAGVAAYWLFQRLILLVARDRFRSGGKMRKDIVDRLGFDALSALSREVDDELAKRRGDPKPGKP